jgi:hypothetical protein
MKSDCSPEDVKARLALQALITKFGSVAEAFTYAVDSGSSVADDIKVLRDNMNRFHQDLQDYTTTMNVDSNTILKVVTKIR